MRGATVGSAVLPSTSEAEPALTVSVLGELSAARAGEPLDLGGRRQRAVLALLVMARGEVVPAETLVDALWGGAPGSTSAAALHSYVSHLRRRLDPQRTARTRDALLVTQGTGYAFRADAEAVDAWRFERLVERAGAAPPAEAVGLLREALALWRGPAYAEYAGEAWAAPTVGRLTELREVAAEQLVAARLATGESAVLVPELEALVEAAPLREDRWRLLVLALYRAGRQGEALAGLRRARAVLADQLGVDPGPALRALEADVLAQSPDLDAPVAPAPRSPEPAAPTLAPPPAPAPPAGLVDRERELRALARSLDAGLGGEAVAALVEGPAGIGKSRLLAEGRRLAADRGALVLSARGSQLEREYGFGVVRQLFEPVLLEADDRDRLLDGGAAPARAVFDDAAAATADGGLFAVLNGLFWLTSRVSAGRPVVLLVDDVQWVDTGSLRFLSFLVRRLEGLPVALVMTLRTGEPHPERQLLDEVTHDQAVLPLQPGPLSVDGVAGLVRAGLGQEADDAFVAACHRTTSGNPLLLRQLLRALEAEDVRPDAAHAGTVTAIGSRAVSSLVLMRLSRLPDGCRSVAHALAVLGDGAALPSLAALTGLPEAEVAVAVATLARAEVVRDSAPLGFVHPLVHDAVYRDLAPGQRELHHERAARILDAAGAAPERVAAHLLLVPARGEAWVVDVLRRAATTARERGTADGASTYLTRAVAEPPAPADLPYVLADLGLVQDFNNGPAAVDHLRQAYDLMPDRERKSRLALSLTRTLVFAGVPGDAARFARAAADELSGDEPYAVDVRQGLLGLERISSYMHGLAQQTWADQPEPPITGTGVGARGLAAQVAWDLHIAGERRERAVELARFALEDGTLLRADTGLMWVVAAMVLDLADEETGSFWDDTLAFAYARGSMFTALSVHLWQGYRQWRQGDLAEGLRSILTSNDQCERWGNPAISVPYGEAFVIGVLLDQGDLAGARAYRDDRPDVPRHGDGGRLFLQATAVLMTAEGRYDEALALLDDIRPLQASVANPSWRPWRSLRADALAGLGRTEEAVALVEAELALCRRWGAPSLVGSRLSQLGRLLGPAGAPVLREAVQVLETSMSRVELARALVALAPHEPDGGVPALQRALALARACGAGGVEADATAALAARGVAADALPPVALPLGTGERRIVRMYADGLEVPEIAQSLFLSVRAVQATLDDVSRRLGVASRSALGAAVPG